MHPIRRVAAVVATTVTAVAMAASGTALNAAAQESAQPAMNPASTTATSAGTWFTTSMTDRGGHLKQTSCIPGGTFCAAVGYITSGGHTTAEAYVRRAGRWAVTTLPYAVGRYLTGVSCASATSCIAIGHGDYGSTSYRWNGSTWALAAVPKDSFPTAVSCSSASACLLLGREVGPSNSWVRTLAWRWNGRAWASVAAPNMLSNIDLGTVSCRTATYCMAAGSRRPTTAYAAIPFAAFFNGTKWTAFDMPLIRSVYDGGTIASVSCPTTNYCAFAGDQMIQDPDGNPPTAESAFYPYLSVMYNGRRLQVSSASNKLGTYNSISCASIGVCSAAGTTARNGIGVPLLASSTGSHFTLDSGPALGSSTRVEIDSVSCWSAGKCVGVGQWSTTANPGHEYSMARN